MKKIILYFQRTKQVTSLKREVILKFPNRIYTIEEFMRARKSIEEGHIHNLRVIGQSTFKNKVEKVLSLIKRAEYYGFLQTYIRKICEIEGISQLRETEVTDLNQSKDEDSYSFPLIYNEVNFGYLICSTKNRTK